MLTYDQLYGLFLVARNENVNALDMFVAAYRGLLIQDLELQRAEAASQDESSQMESSESESSESGELSESESNSELELDSDQDSDTSFDAHSDRSVADQAIDASMQRRDSIPPLPTTSFEPMQRQQTVDRSDDSDDESIVENSELMHTISTQNRVSGHKRTRSDNSSSDHSKNIES